MSTVEVRAAPSQHPMTSVPTPHESGHDVHLTPRFFPPSEVVPLVDANGQPLPTAFAPASIVQKKPMQPEVSRNDDKSASPRDIQLAEQNRQIMEAAAKGQAYHQHELFPGKVKTVPPAMGGCCGNTPLPPPPIPSFAAVEDKFEHYQITSVVIIYNPFSGNGRALGEFKRLVAVLEENKIKVTELKTQGPKHATTLAAETAMDGLHHAFIVIGGDGTFHEFINGYMRRNTPTKVMDKNGPPPVGFIAGGTGNSVMTSLGMTDTMAAAKMITRGLVTRFDLGWVNTQPDMGHGVYWLNLIGWGIAAEANVMAESCRCCGPLRYNFGGVVVVCQNKTRNATLDIDGCKIEGPFDTVFIQNNPHAGSALRIAPYAHVNDGLMDAVVAHHRCCCTVLGMFEDLKKDGAHVYGEAIDYRRFKRLTITTNETQLINVDGENGWEGKSWIIENHPRALPLLFHKPEHAAGTGVPSGSPSSGGGGSGGAPAAAAPTAAASAAAPAAAPAAASPAPASAPASAAAPATATAAK